jgi:hypothetical protein
LWRLREWLGRIDKDSKEARDRRIFELWMRCHTQEEIAEVVGCEVGVIKMLWSKTAGLPSLTKPQQSQAEHATDFDVPIYNVWKQQTKSGQQDQASSGADLSADFCAKARSKAAEASIT